MLYRREHRHAIRIHTPQFDDAILGHEDQFVAGGALCGRLAGGDAGKHEGDDVSRVAHKYLGLDEAITKSHSWGESGRRHGRRFATKQRERTDGRIGIDDPLVTPPPHAPAHAPSLRRTDLKDLLRPENLPVALLEGAGNEGPQHDRVGMGGPGRCLPVEIVEGDPSFLRGRPARQRPLEEATDERPVFPLGRARASLRRDALGKGPGAAAGEVAVDHEEGLGGDGGNHAFADGAGGIGVIKGFQFRHEERAFDEAVDGAALLLARKRDLPAETGARLAGERIGPDLHEEAPPANRRIDRLRRGQEGIADDLRLEPAPVLPPEERVRLIRREALRPIGPRRHPVGPRSEDRAVEVFKAPARVDKLCREPVKQFRMARREAGGAEVVGRGDESATETVLPDAVGGDARRERIGGAYDPFGQRPPPFEARGSRRPTSEQLREAGSDNGAGRGGIAANQNVAGLRRRIGLAGRQRPLLPGGDRQEHRRVWLRGEQRPLVAPHAPNHADEAVVVGL